MYIQILYFDHNKISIAKKVSFKTTQHDDVSVKLISL